MTAFSEQKIARIYSILNNTHMTAVDRLLLVRLEKDYPTLLQGVRTKILVRKLSRDIGISPQSSSRFFTALHTVGAIVYEVKRSSTLVRDDGKPSLVWDAESFVTETDLCILTPHLIDILGTPQRVKHRQASLARSRLARSCPVCGSDDVVFLIYPVCRSCQWHMPLEIKE